MTVKSLLSDIISRVFNSGNDSFDVSIQDQVTPLVNVYMSQVLKDDITLTADATKGAFTLDVSAGHGFTGGGEWVEVFETTYAFQAKVVSVATNEITLDLPVPYAFTSAGATVNRVNVEMNVNGGTTPVEFNYQAFNGNQYDIYGAILTITDGAAMDGGTFGGITALTNGVYFGVESSVRNGYLLNMKRNQDLVEISCTHQYDQKAPAGEYLFIARKFWAGGQGANGVAVRLRGDDSSKVVAVVRDNLTALTSFRVSIFGHLVD